MRFENVTVWTGVRLPDGSWGRTDAVLVRNGRIVALGEAARRQSADAVTDGRGGFLLPAFGDGHVHPVFGGLEQHFAPVRDLAEPAAVARAVGEWARSHPDVDWVRGEGFDPSTAPGGVFLAAWLDEQVPDRPVVLRACDYHTVWVNSEALRRVGYNASTSQPHDGEIVLDSSGNPIGTLREWGAWRPVYALMPRPSEATLIEALSFASDLFAASGITWVQDAWVEPADVDAWLAAEHAGSLAFSADLALWADPNTWRDQVGGWVSLRDRVAQSSKGLLTASTVKFFADGVLEAGTSAMLEPFCDCPHSRGIPNWEPAEFATAVAAIDDLGFTAHIHAIGDLGVRTALDAIEHASVVNAPRDRRWVIVHNQLIDPADVGRFAELGVIANFEPFWSQWDAAQSELTAPRLGPERTARQYQTATLARAGARISFGSDWPVTTCAPLAGIQMAVTRQATSDAEPWIPQERLSVDEALAAYTAGVAFQSGRDDAGVIRPGAVADLVLLASDPRVVDPMSIATITVRGTWRAGIQTYAG